MDLIHPCLESSCSCEILSTVFTVSAQRVNIAAEFNEQPVQFMIRGDLKNMECIIPLIHHMYRSFLRVVHLRSLLIFGSSKKSVYYLHFGLLTKISIIYLQVFKSGGCHAFKGITHFYEVDSRLTSSEKLGLGSL